MQQFCNQQVMRTWANFEGIWTEKSREVGILSHLPGYWLCSLGFVTGKIHDRLIVSATTLKKNLFCYGLLQATEYSSLCYTVGSCLSITYIITCILSHYESKWTPGVGDAQGGLACCDSWGRKESDTTERLIWSDLMKISSVLLPKALQTYKVRGAVIKPAGQ